MREFSSVRIAIGCDITFVVGSIGEEQGSKFGIEGFSTNQTSWMWRYWKVTMK
jgi:hypothetical protein